MSEVKTLNSKWYTIKVQPGREKTIQEKIQYEIDKGKLKEVSQLLVPSEKVKVLREGKKYSREKVLYPGYIFVEAVSYGELSYLIKNIDDAVGLLKDRSGNILPVPKSDIDRMNKKVDEVKTFNEEFKCGDEIKVTLGAFNGFKGTISSVDYKKSKANVEVLIFGRKTDIEIELENLEKVS